MAHPRPRTRHLCRNARLSGDLTEQFREKILNLRSSPKTDYLKEEIFSKFVSADTSPAETRRRLAIEKWLTVEKGNAETNERLISTHEEYNILPRVTFAKFVSFCQQRIVALLGETVPVDALIGSFSGGASTSRSRTESHPASKYLGEAHVTDSCLIWEELLREEIPAWFGGDPSSKYIPESVLSRGYDCKVVVEEGDRVSQGFKDHFSLRVVPGNVMFTVPKNAEIDRVACKEPDVNMFLQKGIGSFIRSRLLTRAGINLNDQSINRSLAREGSLTKKLATLDLSSASDCVTRELIALFLPEAWFTVLDSVRSHVTIIDGEEHRNEMFSSMGNGFTFELESLIFLVLTQATAFFEGVSGRISIYGDDIICPTGIVNELMWVLKYFGFRVNPDKSHYTGGFRESCGGHYLDGIDITPFYVKAPFSTLTDIIHVANQLREWARFEGHTILNPEVEDIWLWLKSQVPKQLWGGEDTSFKYQLVSDDLPSHRLREETKRRYTGAGGYLHWLNTTWRRTSISEAVETSSATTGLSIFRMVKVRRIAVPRLQGYFYHEVVPTTE